MRLNLISCFTTLSLLVTLLSCQDHRIPQEPGQRFRVKKVSTFGLRDYQSTLFNYSPDGRIASYVDYVSSGLTNIPGHTVTLTYNQQGQLTSAQGESIDYYPIRYSYEYNAKGNMVSVKRYDDRNNSGNYALSSSYELTYSTTPFPDMVTKSIYDLIGGARQTNQEQYTYANGNVVSTYQTSIGASTSYTYSDKLNPFYGLIYRVPDASLYSKNVAIDTGLVDTYDANGLLIKRFRSGGPGASQNDFTETIEYEAYWWV